MLKKIEKAYGITLSSAFKAINPIKKRIIKTYCLVHKHINNQALRIMRQEGNIDEYNFYKKRIDYLNKGVVWADQDFKSINHFFHHEDKNGMFGFSNALIEFKKFYRKAEMNFLEDDQLKSMFFLGAACHLVQDSTVPQHVNKKLLDEHRSFELWIIDRVIYDHSYNELSETIEYDKLEDYVIKNAEAAREIHLNYHDVRIKYERYNNIATEIIELAQSTTTGLLLRFYDENVRHNIR